ncbi:MAG: phosphoglycerate kinase [Candidatus Syntropharchaeia archaeon]
MKTMDDISIEDKIVLLRVDINSPMRDGRIMDEKRFESHKETIEELSESKAVILAHQGRPGEKDFTSLEIHAEKFSEVLGKEVKFVDDIFGSRARESIKTMENGDIILLENVRFYSEEMLKRSAEEHASTIFVKKLSKVVQVFVNDAFGTSHRPHLSITGFTPVLPSAAGRLMEREVKNLEKVFTERKSPCIFVLGGMKVDDSMDVMENVLNGVADRVLVSGVVGNVFLFASGINVGKENLHGYDKEVERAKKLLKKYKDKIILPRDVALKKDGKRIEVPVGEISGPIYDIGSETIDIFCEDIKNAEIVVMNGPSGVFEEKEFSRGTYETLEAATHSKFSVIGGGHITAAANELGIQDKLSHVSMGGGACMAFLSGQKLPGIEVLK